MKLASHRQDPFPTAAAKMQTELEEKLPELPWATAEATDYGKPWETMENHPNDSGSDFIQI